ncbi:hypothetical protein [Conexibacter sp. SYSU D00693]|uniref:hypothetical protein n=1 Tax=Conexibacter sp. SYSU D00693 TaxID=2812560 RepID=UPI00196B9F37|nr:hypothetical protein [Conexibacter sp. SYSU D00693]
MARRRALGWAAAAVVGVLGLGVGIGLLTAEEDDGPRVADPVGAVLRRMPADAALVALVNTDPQGGQERRVGALLERIPGSTIALGELGGLLRLGDAGVGGGLPRALAGDPAAVAVTGDLRERVAAWVVRDPGRLGEALDDAVGDGRLRDAGRAGDARVLALRRPLPAPLRIAALAHAGPVLVAATTVELARRTAARRAGPGAGVVRRLRALRAAALVRFAGDGRRLARLPAAAALRDVVPEVVRGVREVDGTLEAAGGAFTGRAAVRLAPGSGVPLALGGAPARAAAFATPLVVGVRDPRPAFDALLRWLGAQRTYDRASDVLRLLRRDDLDAVLRDQLTGTATAAVTPSGRLAPTDTTDARVAVQAPLRDGGDLADLLEDVARVPDLLLGRADVDVDRDGDVYTVRLGETEVRVAVVGDRLGVVRGPGDPVAVATRGPVRSTPPGAGALAARLDADAVREWLVARLGLPRLAALALGPIGDPTLALRAEPGRLDLELTVPITD